jgi:multiple sugar transport system ATP-binding protein
MAEIALEHITKRYGDGFEAVKDLNLDVADGEFMILVGPSGCGKSTALRMVAGLEDITGGDLKIGGQRVNDRAPKDRDIAMVFQNYALYPHMTVRQNMGFALKLAKTPQSEIDQKVSEAARVLDLEQHLDRKPANLSGGQRQRVAMGRAIVRSPSAFLMDEPLSNLDAKLRVQMRTEISRIQSRFETTTIYVTHDQTEALTLGDRIAVMRAGIMQQVGTPGDLYGHPKNLFVAGFIGSPSMNFLPGEIDGDKIRLPLGDLPISQNIRQRLEAGPGGGRGGVIVGLRPEDFEDASLVSDQERQHGITFEAKIDVLESMGSEFYAYFVVESERVSSRELEELANDAGAADLPQQEGSQIVARLDAASHVRQREQAKLWFNTDHIHLFNPENGESLLGTTGDDDRHRSAPSAAGQAQSDAPQGQPQQSGSGAESGSDEGQGSSPSSGNPIQWRRSE